MTKKEYQALNKEMQDLRDKLAVQRKEVDKAYIEDNRPYSVGDVVRVLFKDGTEGAAYVNRFEIDYDANIRTIFNKQKKDGTQSQHQLQTWDYKEILGIKND